MIDKIDSVVNAIGGFLYQPYIVPLFLIVAGLYFTIRTGLIQFRLFGESIHVVAEKPKEKGSISSFGALMVSTASRVGTGNIVGVSTAICLGGFGAVFWMWVVALLGGASAFIESALAQVYKKKDGKGGCVGGPSYYMEQALHQRWLGVIFAVVLILTYVVGYNMLASYNLQDAFAGFGFYAKGRTPYIIGAILAVLFAVCVLGGGKRLTNITGVLVPVMGVLYILVSLVVIFMNIKIFPSVIANIFRDAFNFKAAFSGFAGSCIMWGIKRGLYSNEAGMGSAPNAAATADVSHPAKQGLVQMLSVFIDTLLICSATAFMCLCSGVEPTKEAAGAAYVQASMQQALGSFGPIFIAVSMSLFAFTTLIGNYYYCEGCLKYILRRDPSRGGMLVFRLAATALVFVGAIVSAGLAWDTADMLQGTMVIINIPVILILSNKGLAVLKDYMRQRKEGKNPRVPRRRHRHHRYGLLELSHRRVAVGEQVLVAGAGGDDLDILADGDVLLGQGAGDAERRHVIGAENHFFQPVAAHQRLTQLVAGADARVGADGVVLQIHAVLQAVVGESVAAPGCAEQRRGRDEQNAVAAFFDRVFGSDSAGFQLVEADIGVIWQGAVEQDDRHERLFLGEIGQIRAAG